MLASYFFYGAITVPSEFPSHSLWECSAPSANVLRKHILCVHKQGYLWLVVNTNVKSFSPDFMNEVYIMNKILIPDPRSTKQHIFIDYGSAASGWMLCCSELSEGSNEDLMTHLSLTDGSNTGKVKTGSTGSSFICIQFHPVEHGSNQRSGRKASFRLTCVGFRVHQFEGNLQTDLAATHQTNCCNAQKLQRS